MGMSNVIEQNQKGEEMVAYLEIWIPTLSELPSPSNCAFSPDGATKL